MIVETQMIEITDHEIDESGVLRSVKSGNCGANVLFCGTTRRLTGQRETTQLEYDCYAAMAVRKMTDLAEVARSKWPIEKVSIVHRIGTVPVGQSSIAIAVSSPHRADAFAAGEWLIDNLKTQVPIWKKEVWADGTTEWIHPVEGSVHPDQLSSSNHESSI